MAELFKGIQGLVMKFASSMSLEERLKQSLGMHELHYIYKEKNW